MRENDDEDPLRRVRLDKLEALRGMGIDPYPVGFARTGRNETTTPLLRVAFGCWPICIPGPFRMIC